MKIKNFLVLLLVILMTAALFAGCAAEMPPGNSDAPINSSDGADAEGPADPGEITTIKMWLVDYGNAGMYGTKGGMVEDAINAVSEAEIGVHVDFEWVAAADYPTQITLALSNKEVIDLALFTPPSMNFPIIYGQNVTYDITDLLSEYAPETVALFGDYLNAVSVDGRIYAMPTYRIMNLNTYLIMRKDILDDLGMTEFAQNMSSWEEYEQILAAVTAGGYDLYALGGGYTNGLGRITPYYVGQNFSDVQSFDYLADNYGVVFTDSSGNVSLLAEQAAWVEGAKKIREWFDAGYIHPDVFTAQEGETDYIGNNTIFSANLGTEYGVEASVLQRSGYECVCVEYVSGVVGSGDCQKFGLFVPNTTAEPAAAVKFLNLLYTNAALNNLLAWGIEGETYEIVDGVAYYPEGTDISNCGYHYYDFVLGNQFLITPWEGSPADFRTGALENFRAASPSAYLGLLIDLTEYQTLQVGIASVDSEYTVQLASGNYSDALYNEYMEKLQAAGVEEYLAVYQSQLDGFLGR